MDESDLYYKQQTYLNTCSDADDSTSLPSFPWFPENNRRRKSRLGTHHNQIRRVFQEANSNVGDHSSSNKENIYDRLSSNTSPPDSAPADTQTEEFESLISNDNMETSPFSFTKRKFRDLTSPPLLIPRIFDDGVSPLVTPFEKSRTVVSSFPSFLAEDEINGILREMNSSDNIGTSHFSLSPSSNRTRASTLMLEKSFDASESSVIPNQFRTAETKLNKWFTGELPNDVSSVPAVEDLAMASSEQTNDCKPVADVNSDCMNSTDQCNLSTCSSNSANSVKLSSNSVTQSLTENSGLHYESSNLAVRDLSCKSSTGSSNNFSLKPITGNSSSDCTNSIKPMRNSLQSGNQISDSSHLSQLPVDLSSMQDQKNSANSQSPNETNSQFPIDLSSMLDQENYPNVNPKLLTDLSSMPDQDNYINFKTPNEVNPKYPVDQSLIQNQENSANSQSPAESLSSLPPKEITQNIEIDGVLSSTERKTTSMSISSVAEIPATVKLQKASIPVSDVGKISGSALCDSNLEQKKPSAREPEVPLPNNVPVVPPSQAPKPTVQFVEPPAVREFAVPRNSSKIPAAITVKGKTYKVLNILGSGGSSVVFQVSDPETNELLAIKKVDLPEEDDEITDGYLNEVQMLENLQNCDVIIKIFDHQLVYKNGKKTLYVVMEKGDTDLSSLIKSVNESKKLSIPMIIYYWTEMLAAVNEVHRRGIIHSDLKPANFVLVRGRLKLIDFGIASSIQGDVTSVYKDVFCGTLNYMSPEATCCVECPSGGAGYKITFKTDVWSLGCILYNLVYGRLPFNHIRKRFEKIQAIVSPNVNVEFPEKKDVPPILISLLKSCLEKDYKRRPTVQELLDRTMRIFQCSSID